MADTPDTSTARPDEPKAYQVYYTGWVQGVGFRATTAGIARKYQVTGWVKNLPDGRVQLWVEGPESEIDAFLQTVRSHWMRHVQNEQVEERGPSGKYSRFEIAL